MNAIGPIEAKMKANHAAVRSRLFAEPKIKPVNKAKKQREISEQRLRDFKHAAKIRAMFRRVDIIYASKSTRERRIKAIKEQVAFKYGISIACIESISRNRFYVLARDECAYRIRNEIENMSLPMIGRCLGGRDHTTILTALRRYEKRKREGLE